jgi:hypothetical protein
MTLVEESLVAGEVVWMEAGGEVHKLGVAQASEERGLGEGAERQGFPG